MSSFYLVHVRGNPGVTRDVIEAKLNLAVDWYRFDEGHYILYTTSDEDKWYARLESLIKPDGVAFICKLEKDSSNGWMPKSFWDWYGKSR